MHVGIAFDIGLLKGPTHIVQSDCWELCVRR